MGKWLKVKRHTPPVGERVQICYTRTAYDGRVSRIVTTGFYEDGNTLEDDSQWCCDTDWLYNTGARTDEKTGQYFIPKGWYEVLTSINGEYFCDLDRQTERVTHWQPLPALPEDKNQEKETAAHWIWRDSDCSSYEECICSACGEVFIVECGNNNAPGKYCPECGAFMCEDGSYEPAQ